MYMVQLIYASEINHDHFPPDGAQKIQKEALKYNQANDITGVLLCDGTYFLQAIEGARSRVSHIFAKIASDPRHKRVTLLRFVDISVRDFHEWDMNLLSYDKEKFELLRKYSIQKNFDPYTLSSESSHSLLCQLALMESYAKQAA